MVLWLISIYNVKVRYLVFCNNCHVSRDCWRSHNFISIVKQSWNLKKLVNDCITPINNFTLESRTDYPTMICPKLWMHFSPDYPTTPVYIKIKVMIKKIKGHKVIFIRNVCKALFLPFLNVICKRHLSVQSIGSGCYRV